MEGGVVQCDVATALMLVYLQLGAGGDVVVGAGAHASGIGVVCADGVGITDKDEGGDDDLHVAGMWLS